MRVRVLVVIVVPLVIAGCGANAMRAKPGMVSTHRGQPYQLYTHCGIEWARIRGSYWRARQALSDGNGNPPSGWGNPFQAGALNFRDATTAVFTSRAGTVVFKRTGRTRPPIICS